MGTNAPIYAPGSALDEAFAPDGAHEPVYTDLLGALADIDLESLRARVEDHLRRAGVAFGAAGALRAFAVDPVPRIITADEWDVVTPALTQRLRGLMAFVEDAYGERRMVASGAIPERVIDSARYYEPWLAGAAPPVSGMMAGLDLVRGSDGALRVLEDNTRTPSGLMYAVAARAAVDAGLGPLAPSERLDVTNAFRLLRSTLEGSHELPHVVMLSDGESNSAWYEHRRAAAEIGIAVVTPRDVDLRDGRLVARGDDGSVRAVDVLYRRTDEDCLRDERGKATWIADLLLEPVRSGSLTVVNPLGAGLADDKLVHAYVEEMIRFFLDEEPLLRSVRTFDLGRPDQLAEALERLDELVIKPRDGYGGEGVVIGRVASADKLRETAARLRADSDSYVAQETVELSTHPTVIDGRLEPRHVDLRPFVLGGGDSAAVIPAALTRVAFGAGELVVNSSRNGGGKDTWVMGR